MSQYFCLLLFRFNTTFKLMIFLMENVVAVWDKNVLLLLLRLSRDARYLAWLVRLLLQAMEELNLDRFMYGGVNLTGFSVVNSAKARSMNTIREWCKRHRIVELPSNYVFDRTLQVCIHGFWFNTFVQGMWRYKGICEYLSLSYKVNVWMLSIVS